MPFTGIRAVLKKIMPGWCFKLAYRLSSRVYDILIKIADEAYYLFAYLYYLMKRDGEKLQKIKTINKIRPYTMVGRGGLLATYDIANMIEKSSIRGCFVECGVARGGCSAIMAMVADGYRSDRKLWMFDSYEGLPEPTPEDEYQGPGIVQPGDKSASLVSPGYCLGTYEEVEKLLFSKFRLNKENVFMVAGWFQYTLPEYKNKTGEISFLRIDGDWYESTKCCLENLYDNVVSGGYIFIDDYDSVIGCKKATDEFLDKRNLKVKMLFDNRGGCYFIKP